jgi:hypothetical protein
VTPAQDSPLSQKRPWLAAGLSVLIPGLGHLYLRLWGRALLWLGLSVLASFLVFPGGALPSSASVDAILSASEALSLRGTVLVFGVSMLCVVDAYMMAQRINNAITRRQRISSGESLKRCPKCGKELDPDIEFCHWCTTELETIGENEG